MEDLKHILNNIKYLANKKLDVFNEFSKKSSEKNIEIINISSELESLRSGLVICRKELTNSQIDMIKFRIEVLEMLLKSEADAHEKYKEIRDKAREEARELRIKRNAIASVMKLLGMETK